MKVKVTKLVRFFDFGIFPGTLCFCSGYTVLELIEIFKTEEYKDYEEYLICLQDEEILNMKSKFFAHYCTMKKGNISTDIYLIVLTERFLFKDGSFVILAHEVLHICQFFLKRILNMEKEIEAVAYFHSYLMQKCLDSLRGKDLI